MEIVRERLDNCLVDDSIVIFPLEAFPDDPDVLDSRDGYYVAVFLQQGLLSISTNLLFQRSTYSQHTTLRTERLQIAMRMNKRGFRVESGHQLPLLAGVDVFLSLDDDYLVRPDSTRQGFDIAI